MQYRANLIADEGAAFVVTFPAFPEANTGGADKAEALENAQEALDLTVLTYVKDGRQLPADDSFTQSNGDDHRIGVSAYVLAKIALIEAFRASGLSQTAFAKRLGKAETEVRRMLDPYHATKLISIEFGLRMLGKRLVLSVEQAA